MKITCTSTSLNDNIPLTGRSLQKRGKNRYRILYSEVNTSQDADVQEMFDNFQAEISVSNPYDDAEYAWAIIKDGVIRIIKDGKVIAKEFYFNADDEDLENEEWCDSVINRALDALEKLNSKIESRIIHSSKKVETDDEFDGFTYVGTQNGWFLYRKIVNGKGKWKALDGYKFDEKDFAENAIDITYHQALGYEPLPARNQTEELSRKLGEALLPNSSVTGAADIIDGYWFFTKHGVQPGSIPKDVEILDIVDTARGTFVKFNRFLSTKELNYYDMIEKSPEGITSAKSTKISWNDMEFADQLAAIQNYVKEYEGTRVFEDFAESVNADVDDVIDLFSDMESRNMLHIPYVIQKDSEFANDDIYSSEEITSEDSVEDDVYEDIKEIGQEFTSENTSINSKKLPAVFNMVSFNPGTVNLDYGGGRFDNVAEYLEQYDVVNLVYDPYNRSSEHNREVIRLIREHGGADTATCSNVLNVIKEPEVRQNVLKNISKLVKAGGTIYITVYEGKGNNEGTPTKSGYQLNRKTADYIEEIQEVFPDCKRRGKLIECVNSGAITSSIYDEADMSWILLERKSVPDVNGFYTDYCLYQNEDETEYVCIFGDRDIYTPDNTEPDAEFDTYEEAKDWFDNYEGFIDEDDDIYSSKESDAIPKLREDLKTAVNEMMISDEFGFSENEAEQYSAVDVYRKDDNIVCEIRAEVSFEGLMDLCEKCNPIVEKYYNNAYFDPEEPGIATAYIPVSSVTGAITAMEDSMLEPPEPEEYDEITEEFEIEVDLSGVVIRLEDESWEYEDDSYEFAANEDGTDYRSEYGVYVDDTTGVVEKIDELIEKDIPIGTGRYELSGYAYLVYDVTGIDSDKDYYPDGDYEEEIYTDNAKAEFNFEKSYVKDFQIKKL